MIQEHISPIWVNDVPIDDKKVDWYWIMLHSSDYNIVYLQDLAFFYCTSIRNPTYSTKWPWWGMEPDLLNGKLAWDCNRIKVLMGVKRSGGDPLTMCKLKNTYVAAHFYYDQHNLPQFKCRKVKHFVSGIKKKWTWR